MTGFPFTRKSRKLRPQASRRVRTGLVLISVFLTIAVAVTVLLFVTKSGLLKKDPVVETQACNLYDEKLRVVMGDSFAPFSFEQDGGYTGHDVELVNELANRMGVSVELGFYSWSECLEKILSGEADIIMSADYELPIDGIVYSIPTANTPWMAFCRADNAITGYADLFGKRIGIGEGTNPLNHSRLTDNYVTFPSYEEAFVALARGEVDTVITQYQVGTYIVRRHGYTDIGATCEITGGHLAIGMRADRTDLFGRVDKALAGLSREGTLTRLNEKWCGTFVKNYTLREIWASNPGYFIVSVVVLLIAISLLILFLYIRHEQRKEAQMLEQIELQNHLIKHLIKEYSEIYYIRTGKDKTNDSSVLLFKGGILSDDVLRPDDALSFTEKLDAFINTLVVPSDRDRVREQTRRNIVEENTVGGAVHAVPFRIAQETGLHHYQIRFARVGDETTPLGYVIGLRSTDSDVKAREALANAKAKAEAANEAKTMFLFNMSHDIRTPLNAILGFTEIAEKNIGDSAKVLDCLKKTRQSGSLLLSLISGVLEMSRIEAGKAELNEQPTMVDYSFKNIESTMQALAADKGVALDFSFGKVTDRYVYVDIDRVNRVLINLISNAVKYTERGGSVRVRCEQSGKRGDAAVFRYTVKDTGVGMSPDFQQHLFEKFSRENNATASGVQGTGLGLAVARSFVDLMHGSIECASVQGKGTTFTVTFPFRLQTEEGLKQYGVDLAAESARTGSAAKAPANLSGKRMLLVEDNELNREIASFILEEAGITVEQANDGTFAVAMLREKGPGYYDAVLMDIQMPVMNGYEATRAIRQMYPGDRLPIIAVSANAFVEDRVASFEAGMDDHIAKPINTGELFNALSKLL